MEKLKRQLADADAALEARKKPAEDVGPKIIGEGLVIDEWVSMFSWLLIKFSLQYITLDKCFFIYNIIPYYDFRKRGGKDTSQSSREMW